jgi:hypothetical protein
MLPILGPLKKLLFSRKFLLLVLDTVISVSLFYFAKFEGVEFLIATLQPVFVFIIVAIAIEDAAEKSAG